MKNFQAFPVATSTRTSIGMTYRMYLAAEVAKAILCSEQGEDPKQQVEPAGLAVIVQRATDAIIDQLRRTER